MLKISAKLKRGHSQRKRQMQVGLVKCKCGSRKLATFDANRCQLCSQVYHTERPPYLSAAHSPWVCQWQLILVVTYSWIAILHTSRLQRNTYLILSVHELSWQPLSQGYRVSYRTGYFFSRAVPIHCYRSRLPRRLVDNDQRFSVVPVLH